MGHSHWSIAERRNSRKRKVHLTSVYLQAIYYYILPHVLEAIQGQVQLYSRLQPSTGNWTRHSLQRLPICMGQHHHRYGSLWNFGQIKKSRMQRQHGGNENQRILKQKPKKKYRSSKSSQQNTGQPI